MLRRVAQTLKTSVFNSPTGFGFFMAATFGGGWMYREYRETVEKNKRWAARYKAERMAQLEAEEEARNDRNQ
eukprot:jgi/Bigna1/144531/aug1.88_g19239